MIDPNDKRTMDFIGRDEAVTLRLVARVAAADPVMVVEDDADGPLDAAARQRRARAKRKKLADEQGLKAVWLLQTERDMLASALGLVDRLNDDKTTPEARLELLQKLKPGASFPDIDSVHGDQAVQPIFLNSTERCVMSLGLLAHEDLDHRPADWEISKKPGFDALLKKLWPEGDNGRYLAEPHRSSYRPSAYLRNQLAEQRTMVKRLQDLLNKAETESGIVELRTKAYRLEQDNALLEAERNNAFAAYRVLENRLKAAGLSTDYRNTNLQM